MKITQEMIEEAIEKVNSRNQGLTTIDLSRYSRSELANVLTGIIVADQLVYDLTLNNKEFGLETLDEVVATLKEHAKPGDEIYVEVHEPQDLDEIGVTEWTYMDEGEFVHQVTAYGAGINLHEKVNELAKQPARA